MMSFKIFVTEGMIKLPEKMFKDGETKIVADLCSFVITELSPFKSDPDVHKFIDHVKSTASKYSAPLRFLKKKIRSKFKIELSLESLPEKYRAGFEKPDVFKDTPPKKLKLELDLDWTQKGRLTDKSAGGFFKNTEAGKIVVGIGSLVDLDFKRTVSLNNHLKRAGGKSHLYNELMDLFDPRLDRILLTFEHELTHYVQYKALHKLSAVQTYGADEAAQTSRIKGKKDAYYNSQVEFDPLIRTSLGEFHRMERDNIEAKMKGTRRGWIDIFVGAKAIPTQKFEMIRSEKHGGFIEPSEFFLSLKKHSPDKWKKAVKLFTQELERRYPA